MVINTGSADCANKLPEKRINAKNVIKGDFINYFRCYISFNLTVLTLSELKRGFACFVVLS